MEEKSPKISIIVPVYNTVKYLQRCLDSILKQTYSVWECLVIDDGSTDGSSVICDEYAGKDIRFRSFHKTNGGLSSARNYGIEEARGDYIIFLDSDDYWLDEDSLEVLLETALGADADIVRGEHKEVDESGNELNARPIKNTRAILEGKTVSSGEFLRDVVCGEYFVCLYLYKQEILQSLRFNEQQKFQEDIDFCIRLFVKDLKCVYVPKAFYAYSKRPASLTTRINVDNLRFSFHLCDVFYQYADKTCDANTKAVYRNSSVMMYYWTLNTLSESPYYEKASEIIRDLDLKDLRRRTIKRLFQFKVINKALVFILSPVGFSTKMMRLKNLAVRKIRTRQWK